MLCIYIVISISTIGYYLRKARDEFNPLLHLVLPAIGSVILIPVLAAAVGVGLSVGSSYRRCHTRSAMPGSSSASGS